MFDKNVLAILEATAWHRSPNITTQRRMICVALHILSLIFTPNLVYQASMWLDGCLSTQGTRSSVSSGNIFLDELLGR